MVTNWLGRQFSSPYLSIFCNQTKLTSLPFQKLANLWTQGPRPDSSPNPAPNTSISVSTRLDRQSPQSIGFCTWMLYHLSIKPVGKTTQFPKGSMACSWPREGEQKPKANKGQRAPEKAPKRHLGEAWGVGGVIHHSETPWAATLCTALTPA